MEEDKPIISSLVMSVEQIASNLQKGQVDKAIVPPEGYLIQLMQSVVDKNPDKWHQLIIEEGILSYPNTFYLLTSHKVSSSNSSKRLHA
jgi:hypothetical protein